MRYCQVLCIGDGRILFLKIISGLLGLFFAIDEADSRNDLWNQLSFEAAPMLLGLQTEFKDHR